MENVLKGVAGCSGEAEGGGGCRSECNILKRGKWKGVGEV